MINFTSDLDLHPMTLVLELDLDMVKMSYHTKNEVSVSRHSKVIACTDTHTHTHTHTHRQYENITFPRTRAVKIGLNRILTPCISYQDIEFGLVSVLTRLYTHSKNCLPC